MEEINVKKQNEYKVLSKIYNDSNRYIIKTCEQPDFIIFDTKTKNNFGVEITDLYYSTSSAKLKNIPNFVGDCLKKEIPKKDQKKLSKQLIYVDIDNRWQYLGDTVGEKFKTIDDYTNALINTITIKDKKMNKYHFNDYCELFIQDKENYFFFKEIKKLKELYDNVNLNNCIKYSKFERIYLFTVINKHEVLLIFGNVEEGPLAVNETKLKIHKDYMKSLFEEV